MKCLDPSCILNKKPQRRSTLDLPPQADGDGEAPHGFSRACLPPTLPPEELEDLGLTPDMITRYRVLKRKAALDADPNIIYCPRIWCRAPSRSSLEEIDRNIGSKDLYLTERHLELKRAELNGTGVSTRTEAAAVPESDSQPRERLDICSSCAYSFCKVCLKGWHGEYVFCRSPNAPKTAEELATEEFLNSATTKCPSCEAAVIKSYGCNHMTCKCGTHFCFLCGAYILPINPYSHFNDMENESCYMRLWEGEDGDGVDLDLVVELA